MKARIHALIFWTLTACLVFAGAQPGWATMPFTKVFSQNAVGDITLLGNTVLADPGGVTPGPAENNNNISMVYATVDASAPKNLVLGGSAVSNSSNSTLNLPAGSTVLFAGLFWGGSYPSSGVTLPTSGTTKQISLKMPGDASYRTITSGTYIDLIANNGDRAWGSYTDITAAVQLLASANGTYSAANVWAGNGQNCCGGWCIAIAYKNPSLPPRNLTVFNGFQVITQTAGSQGAPSVTVPISGFTTPKYGQVNSTIGVMGYEGDAGLTGDQLLFNSTNLTDPIHSATNYWCSAISSTGSYVTTRTPSFQNNLGFDCSTVALSNPSNTVLANSATSAQITFTTTGDTYYPALLTVATDLYAPVVIANKTTLDLNADNVTPGDVLQYTINIVDTTGDDAGNCILTDPMPAGVTYVPGSIVISGSMNAGPKTDAAGDDQAEFVSGSNMLVVRLGAGANASNGGTIYLGGSTTITYKVQVSGTIPNGYQINNQAELNYNSVAHPTIELTTASSVATVDNSKTIEGTVFEDVNYAGGLGRGPLTSGSAPIPPASIQYPSGAAAINGVRVELYDGSGNFVKAVTTGTSIAVTGTANGPGVYDFTDVQPGSYTVRVVSNSVTSSRGGSGLLPVQTYRTAGTSGSTEIVSGTTVVVSGVVTPVGDHVGGENPALVDAGPNLTSANLSTLTTGSTTAQSITQLNVGVNDILRVDFGYNFDTIVNTNASRQGSLDQFIKNANSLPGTDTAIFMIPNGTSAPGLNSAVNLFNGTGGSYASITQSGSLTAITAPVVIDATTQPGYAAPTPVVEINGSGSGGSGLIVSGGGSTIKGLAINRFTGAGISITGAGSNTIIDNIIGAGPSGTASLPNGAGIIINGSPSNTIGSTTAGLGNVISGNSGTGIQITGAAATGNLVYGNNIGVDVTGSNALGNVGSGVLLDTSASGNSIGGTAAGAANIIAANGAGGVVVGTSATGNPIRRNSIYDNTGLGIDLSANSTTPDGVTPNNGSIGSGANNGMDYPVIQSAVLNGATLTISGYIGSAGGQNAFNAATVEFYKADNSPADQNGANILGDGLSLPHGEGRIYLGTVTASGSGTFTASLAVAGGVVMGDLVTALATSTASPANNTSEFSADATVSGGGGITGFVYLDTNHNSKMDSGEIGTGLTLYAKLLLNGTGSAVYVATVDPSTGAYTFSNVTQGSYSIVINGTNSLANVTPGYPAGWTGTEFGSGQHDNVTVSGFNNSTPLNFGVVHAATIAGKVFDDNGAGGGTANNGTAESGEAGIGGAAVSITDSTGSIVYDRAISATDGSFTLYLSSTVASGALKVKEVNIPNTISTGANVGTLPSATYDRPSDTISFSNIAGTSYSGIQFGDVPGPVFLTDGQQTGAPGNIIFFPHRFTLNTSGTVTFSSVGTPTPGTITGWVETFYVDTNANGKFDSGEPMITGPLTVTSATTLNILVKEFIPVGAPYNARDSLLISAIYKDSGASPALSGTLTRTDVVIVGDATQNGLVLTKSVDVTSAKPGDTITYKLVYTNNSTAPLSNIVVYDSTPVYTTFLSGTCYTPLPQSLTAVAPLLPVVGASGTSGSIQWSFTGQLQPSATGTLSFQVKVAP